MAGKAWNDWTGPQIQGWGGKPALSNLSLNRMRAHVQELRVLLADGMARRDADTGRSRLCGQG